MDCRKQIQGRFSLVCGAMLSLACSAESGATSESASAPTAGQGGVLASGGSAPAAGGTPTVSGGTAGSLGAGLAGTPSATGGVDSGSGGVAPGTGGAASAAAGTAPAAAANGGAPEGAAAGTGGAPEVSAGSGGQTTAGTGGTPGPSAGSGGLPGGAGGTVAATAGSGGSTAGVTGEVRWVGRVDTSDPEAVRFAWQGAGVVANVQGDTIAVALRTEGTPTVYFQPVIDGVPGARFNVDTGSDQTVTLGSGLGDSLHLVELYRETEGMYGVSTFLGFTSGSVVGAPASNGRLIEVVGDSISAGYGNLGSEPHPDWVANPACHWTAENSSWFVSYAEVAGRALEAEVSSIAHSGWGIVRDYTGDTSGVLSSIYENTLGIDGSISWSFERQASVVIVNLGTNDWATGDPGVAYEDAYVAFVETLRARNPDAWILLTIGSMLGEPELSQVNERLSNVVARVNASAVDEKLATFDLGTQSMGADGTVPTGCDWHPNVADHARMAGILEQQLASHLGW